MDRSRFEDLTSMVQELIPAAHGYTLDVSGEESDFVRFTHGRVRQPGSVRQIQADIRVMSGKRHATSTVSLVGEPDEDRRRVAAAIDEVVAMLPHLPDDPHLLLAEEVQHSESIDPVQAAEPELVVDTVHGAAAGTDLVGIYAGGSLWRGFANHHGQRNWFRSGSSLLDYCLVHDADKAVKASVGGKTFDVNAVRRSIDGARRQLGPLSRPSRSIPPGEYRAFLTPIAVMEIVDLLSRGGYSARAQATKVSPLQKLTDGSASLSPLVSLTEDTAGGTGPNFQGEGFVLPPVLPLIKEGRHAGSLVSPRSASEYGLQPNAGAGEYPGALALDGGDLDEDEILQRLGKGLWISNLWYLNFSDRNAGRITGMTRFATFWVEEGEVVAPVSVMRFDASVYDLLGASLEALTKEVAFLPSASTYGARSTESHRMPGALVSSLPFTL